MCVVHLINLEGEGGSDPAFVGSPFDTIVCYNNKKRMYAAMMSHCCVTSWYTHYLPIIVTSVVTSLYSYFLIQQCATYTHTNVCCNDVTLLCNIYGTFPSLYQVCIKECHIYVGSLFGTTVCYKYTHKCMLQ